MADGGKSPEQLAQSAYEYGYDSGVVFVKAYPHNVHADLQAAVPFAIGAFWSAVASGVIIAPEIGENVELRRSIPMAFSAGFIMAYAKSHGGAPGPQGEQGEAPPPPASKPPADPMFG